MSIHPIGMSMLPHTALFMLMECSAVQGYPWNKMSSISGCSCTNLTPGPSALLSILKMQPHTCTISQRMQSDNFTVIKPLPPPEA